MLVGIVGKPSSGKSSFINALTNSNIAKVGNYPFTTLEPNIGVGYAFKPCVCQELAVNCGQCINNLRPIAIKVIDVAGLVPDASKGKGMGNQFLSELSQADVLLHIIDCSGSLNEEGEDVDPGSHNPLKDIKFLENEIDSWIYGILAKDWTKAMRTARSNKIPLLEIFSERLSGLKISKGHVNKVLTTNLGKFPGNNINDWTEEHLKLFAGKIRKLSKPIILVLNKIDKQSSEKYYSEIKDQFTDRKIIVASALAEIVLQNFEKQGKIQYFPLEGKFENVSLNEKEKKSLTKIKSEILNKYGSTGVANILSLAIDMLGYITAYPVADISHLTDQDGRILPDVHLIPKGTTSKELAGKIHMDLYNHFVCGVDARNNKRLSDSYELQDRDVIKIMSSK